MYYYGRVRPFVLCISAVASEWYTRQLTSSCVPINISLAISLIPVSLDLIQAHFEVRQLLLCLYKLINIDLYRSIQYILWNQWKRTTV